MKINKKINKWYFFLALLPLLGGCEPPRPANSSSYLNISGIYPHLAAFNQPADSAAMGDHKECGIGAVVPWAGKLWYITYPPHQRRGSNDKLYEVDEALNLTVRKESVGGTHANRFIHQPSGQLIMGPYFIDQQGNVRAADVNQLEGRLTATTEHLTDPENKVMFYDMEGAVYEVDVHSLAVNKLFEKPVPGWHGKGAYVAQGRLVVANNGEHAAGNYEHLLVGGPAEGPAEAGVLAEWDGQAWRIVERKKFTDVTGPGGIKGSPSPESPLWSMGWDAQSVILKVLHEAEWYTYRLPKASYTFDPRHGWYTEWPRIREYLPGKKMMVMHGGMYDFPADFSSSNTAGIRPITSHLRYIPDFTHWKGQIVLAADDASSMQNPWVGQPQSNLWFGSEEALGRFGPRIGWGGPWVNTPVEAEQASDPFLVAGYQERTLYLSHHAEEPVRFSLEIDRAGIGTWETWKAVTVNPKACQVELLPASMDAEWMRVRVDRACQASAYFHLFDARKPEAGEARMFDGLVNIDELTSFNGGTVRPAGHNRSLQYLLREVDESGKAADAVYKEVRLSEDAQDLLVEVPEVDYTVEIQEIDAHQAAWFSMDDASVIAHGENGTRYRLPKGHAAFEGRAPLGKARQIREAVSERYLANIHGTFYEVPRSEGAGNHVPDFEKLKPVASHSKYIVDFCTWRGLLVLSGVKNNAAASDHIYRDEARHGLWFGMIDDLWKLGKPVGVGGPWKEDVALAGEPSDPYLMLGYDDKRLEISHDHERAVTFRVEVNASLQNWQLFKELTVLSGEPLVYEFPKGLHAHWVRLVSDQDCTVTATFSYE